MNAENSCSFIKITHNLTIYLKDVQMIEPLTPKNPITKRSAKTKP